MQMGLAEIKEVLTGLIFQLNEQGLLVHSNTPDHKLLLLFLQALVKHGLALSVFLLCCCTRINQGEKVMQPQRLDFPQTEKH